jgi:tetratricopeptide (TPR) repeat protein
VALAVALARTNQQAPSVTREISALLQAADRASSSLLADDHNDDTVEARARVLANLADFRRRQGDTLRASELAARAVDLRRELFALDPVDTLKRRRLAGSIFLHASILGRQNEQERAEQLMQESRRHFEFLVEADPRDIESRSRLGQLYGQLADRRLQQNVGTDEAIDLATHAVRQFDAVVEVSDSQTAWGLLADHAYWLAETQFRADAAADAHRTAARTVARLVADNPDGISSVERLSEATVSLLLVQAMSLAKLSHAGETPPDTLRRDLTRLKGERDALRDLLHERGPASPVVANWLRSVDDLIERCDDSLAAAPSGP